MMPIRLSLNPELNPAGLAEAYSKNGRLQVRDFLREPAAEAILEALEAQTPWGLCFNDGDRVVELDADRVARLTAEERLRIGTGVTEGARSGFQFLYGIYPLLSAYFNQPHHKSPLFSVYEWLNGEEFLGLMRTVTGIPEIIWADAQATRYGSGHFLKYHTDETPSQKRLAAYVLNFTKGWGRDWGGYLQFFDESYDIERGYRPVFNAVNVFTVPAHHSVGMVSSYAPRGRISITGWLRGDRPPGPIGGRG